MPRDRVAVLEARLEKLKSEVESLTRLAAAQNEIVAENRRLSKTLASQWMQYLEGLKTPLDPAAVLAGMMST